MERLDIYDELSEGMKKYLSTYGWHFSKRAFEWAVSKMKDRNGQKVQPMTKDAIEAQIKTAGITIDNNLHYDVPYVFQMAMSDYMGSSLKDVKSVAQFTKDYLDDKDGSPTRAMDEFYGACIGKGCIIDWWSLI